MSVTKTKIKKKVFRFKNVDFFDNRYLSERRKHRHLNRTCLGGKLQMTFCVLQISLNDKRMTYANASHEFPICLKRKETMAKKDIEVLTEATGPRLGQDIESQYTDTSIQILPGSRLMLFSDGIYDVEDSERKPFGERQFIKAVLKANQSNGTARGALSEIVKAVQIYGNESALTDDISLVCIDID